MRRGTLSGGASASAVGLDQEDVLACGLCKGQAVVGTELNEAPWLDALAVQERPVGALEVDDVRPSATAPWRALQRRTARHV